MAGLLLKYVLPRRWFRGKSRTPRGAEIADLIPLVDHSGASSLRAPAAANWLALLAIAYEAGPADLYLIPLAKADRDRADDLRRRTPHAIIELLARDGEATSVAAMVDGLATGQAAHGLMDVILAEREIRGLRGTLRGEAFREAAPLGRVATAERVAVTVPDVEQTNSTLMVGEHLLKIYRQMTAGPSPELEVGRFLTAHCDPPCAPRVLGALSYETFEGVVWNVGIAHEYVANDGDAWSLALRELRAYFERASAAIAGGARSPSTDRTASAALVGRFQTLAETLGRRTGQLHLTLAGSDDGHGDPLFAPEPLTAADRHAMVERSAAMLQETLSALERTIDTLGADARAIAESLRPGMNARARLTALLDRARAHPLSVVKTRIHGDLHLGQVLSRGDDFVIIDFEGEPTRPLDQRRAKTSPLRDVMGMARSFDYAAEAALRELAAAPERRRLLEPWAVWWSSEVTAAYLNAYLATVKAASFVPKRPEDLELLLDFHELEKVIYELAYEMNNRPDWIEIPLRGLARLARDSADFNGSHHA